MTSFTPVSALIGGALIGLAAVLLMRLNGRIAGISGITNGALKAAMPDRLWRVLFVAGLVVGGFVFQAVSDQPLLTREDFPMHWLAIAGLLVGIGTRIGSGCTSGHGVCGIARLSTRSIVATAVFMAVGVATATLIARIGLPG